MRAAGRLVATAALAGGLALAWRFVGLGPALLSTEALRAAGRLLASLFPPDLSPSFLALVGASCLRTAAIAVAGTLLAGALGLPLGLLATPSLFRRGPLLEGDPPSAGLLLAGACSRAAAGALRLLRAIPDLVWALLFVVAFGLGPLAGALALGVNSAGVLGKVAADLFEGVPPRPLQALHATGASRAQAFLFAAWPQAAPALAGYVLYTFECCMRAAAVLGMVGAGGLGHELQLSLRMFEYGQVLTLLAALWLLLLVTEQASNRLRRRWQSAAPVPRLSAGHARGTLARGAAWLALVLAALHLSGFTDALAAAPGLLARCGRFARALFPPDLSPGFLSSLAAPLAQTLAIAVVGTLIGTAVGGVLALPATRTLALPSPLEPGRRSAAQRALRRGLHQAARWLLALLRAIPELVWVLLCIVAVGLGPAPGALALGLHTAGVLGRLYAETLEDVPPRAAEALLASGATRAQALLWAAWPLARPTLVAYTLLRWETNLRVASVVGLVGGGGLGLVLSNAVQLGFHERAMTVVGIIWLLVAASDALSDRLRAAAAA